MLFVQALFSKKEDSNEKESISAQNAAKTLAGYEGFSFFKASVKALEKGIRMIMFLILPALAWENLNFWRAVKKGVTVFKTHLSEFVTGFVLTGVATMIIFLPPTILFSIANQAKTPFPDWVWILTIIYLAFAWSYSIYLEQMFAAELYLWNMKWEKEVTKAQQKNVPAPSLRDVPKPSLLDEVRELVEKSSIIT